MDHAHAHLAHMEQRPPRRLVLGVEAAAAAAAVRDHVHRQREDGADLVVAQSEVVPSDSFVSELA